MKMNQGIGARFVGRQLPKVVTPAVVWAACMTLIWTGLLAMAGPAVSAPVQGPLSTSSNDMAGETAQDDVRVLKDVSYLSDQEADDYCKQRCHLDWYLPSDKETVATVVWFHGGGLRNGAKDGEHEVQIARHFAKAGFAFASVNYRLSPKAKYPAYIEDAAAAVAYVKSNVARHGGDPKHIFVSGHSAGGYLTLMLALDPKYLEAHDVHPSDLAGYMPVAGQTITHSTVRSERGISENQPVIDSAAPSFHVATNTAPILCIAGGKDLPARAEENQYLVAMLNSSKAGRAVYREFEDRDHGTVAFGLSEPDDAVFQTMDEFMMSILK